MNNFFKNEPQNNNVEFIKGDLFTSPNGSILIHSCNCEGKWNSGIAAEFKKRYPRAFELYKEICNFDGESLWGTALIIDVGDYKIGCLFTSRGDSVYPDNPDHILEATRFALCDLILQNDTDVPMCMPKINSGVFKVPWKDTLEVLNEFENKFIVYEK